MAETKHNLRERWQRSLAKAITYRCVILILDFSVIFLLTGRYDVALGFMVVSNFYTTLAYYLHERVWDRVKWGTEARKQKN